MTDTDVRSYRIALIADRFVNPLAGGLDAIPVLLECGWGVMQLPAETYGVEASELMLEQVAEQAQEFHRRGYDLVLVGNHPRLSAALARTGVREPEQIDPKSPDDLRAFLRARPEPVASRTGPNATRPG